MSLSSSRNRVVRQMRSYVPRLLLGILLLEGPGEPHGDAISVRGAVSIPDLDRVADTLHLFAEPLQRAYIHARDRSRTSAEAAAVSRRPVTAPGSASNCTATAAERTFNPM